MIKYRVLNQVELDELETEFIQFLVVNGVTDDWVRLKEEEKNKAKTLIELFSDVVWQNIIDKVKFLELYTDRYIQAIQCNSDKFIMVAVTHTDKSFVFTEKIKLETASGEDFLLHTSEKEYTKDRGEEIFKLLNQGYQISEGAAFKKLILASVK